MTTPLPAKPQPWDRDAAVADANSTLANYQIRKVFLELLLLHDPEPVDFDLVRKRITLPEGVHLNVFGAAAMLCLQQGLAVPVGLVRSARPTARKSKSQKWIIADKRRVKAWLDAHAHLELPVDPQMQMFDGGAAQ